MMKTIMAARSPQESSSSFSFSRRHFQKIIEKVVNKEHGEEEEEEAEEDYLKHLTSDADADDSCHKKKKKKKEATTTTDRVSSSIPKLIKSALAAAVAGRTLRRRPRSRVVCGTLFGYRRGHVRLAFQPDPKSAPALLVQLAVPTAALVGEMASGLVRIALECDRPSAAAAAAMKNKKSQQQLVGEGDEEVEWRAYCNGKKCGLARSCGAEEARWVLGAVEAVTTGAGVLPGGGPRAEGRGRGDLGEMMYMRARFERVVGSRDSEAFYMLNPPDGTYSGPELSLYLLRL